MIEAARQLIPSIITPAAINANITVLNTLYGASVSPLSLTNPVIIDCWDRALLDLPRPSIGYTVGWDKDLPGGLQSNQLRRWGVPVYFYILAPAAKDKETALQHVAILYEAFFMVLDSFTSGLEGQQITGGGLTRAIALISQATHRTFTLDATGSSKIPGIMAAYDFTMYGTT